MRLYLYSAIICTLLLSACIGEDRYGCSPDANASEVLVRIVGDYKPSQLSKLDLWIESSDYDSWYRVKHYSEVEIAGKDYVKIMLPMEQQYRFVVLGNAINSSIVVAPPPQNQIDTYQGSRPMDNSMVRYVANGSFNMPVDNLYMSMPITVEHNTSTTPQRVDIPIDCIVSLIRLSFKSSSVIGMRINATIFNSVEGVKFNSEQLPFNLPVLNSRIIDKTDYILDTVIFPSSGTTSDIRLLVQIKDLNDNEIWSFEQKDIHISAKEVYTITFDGATFTINVSDWDGVIDVDPGVN